MVLRVQPIAPPMEARVRAPAATASITARPRNNVCAPGMVLSSIGHASVRTLAGPEAVSICEILTHIMG
ncbi:protein of unknown function [Rhodovastum atsumiense]|nr:protein of unknown function [Rhodovastum atsumiense]